MNIYLATAFLFVGLALPFSSRCEPDLRGGRRAGALRVYQDNSNPLIFYYPPGDLALGTSPLGEPDLNFLLVRYTGTASRGDKGALLHRSLLNFRIVMLGPTAAEIRDAQEALRGTQSRGANVQLLPLPIQKLDAVVINTPIETGGVDTNSQTLAGGHFEEATNAVHQPTETYWKERVYTLRLEPATAQVLWDLFEKGGLVLSIGYAFYAKGISPTTPIASLTGSPVLVSELQKRLSDGASNQQTNLLSNLIHCGATAISIRAGEWPNRFKKFDINERTPPGYAVLDVYCYDFNNSLRSDLYEKHIEFEAEAINGRSVLLTGIFTEAQSDLYVRSLRFPVAVRLDRPYRFRVREIGKGGEIQTSGWSNVPSWTPVLDMTTSRKSVAIIAEKAGRTEQN